MNSHWPSSPPSAARSQCRQGRADGVSVFQSVSPSNFLVGQGADLSSSAQEKAVSVSASSSQPPGDTVNVRRRGPTDAAAFQALRLRALREDPVAFASSYEDERDTPLETVPEPLVPTCDRAIAVA